MDSHIKVLVRVGGTWDTLGNFSSKYDTVIDVRNEVSLKSLMDTIKADISMDWYQNDIRFSYMVALCPPPIVIADDSELLFYLRLKSYQNDVPYLPLCMEVLPTATVAQLNGQANSSCALSPDINICYNSHSVDSTPNLTGQSNTNHMSIKISSGKSDHSNSMKRTSQTKRRRHPTNPVDVISHYHPTTLQVDSIYKSKQDLYHHLQMYAVSNSFQYKTKRSNRTVLHVVCVDARCSWAVRAVSLDNSPLFQIRRFDSYHSCPVDFREGDHRQATSTFLADLVLHCYVEATRKQYPPNDIWDDMRREFGIAMSYRKALLVKQKALKKLYGSDEESYQLLPSLCYMLEIKNPGSSIRHGYAGHGYCTEHIARNLRTKFKGPKEDLTWKFRKASRAATEVECEEYLQMLEEQDHRIRAYLSQIGQTKWARCKSGPYRHSVMTSNAAESMNNVNNSAREYPIFKLVDFIHERMQKWFHECFETASTTSTILPNKLESELITLQRDAFNMKVKPACPYEFELSTAIGSRPGLSCYNFISPYYKREALVATYSGIVHPIGDKSTWDIPSNVKTMVCKPPLCNKRPLGGQRRGGYHPLVNFISAKVGKSRSVPGA
ncbi:hypothetical protein DM860_013119 [Cuscuta australis]|uniref:GAR domain-containing protein n=1 Tax=Cuscuta australis TaxID=267555 RepID=A0A328D787_9ASTE|nr:hypothetical protein DM860_013119 [Cuscuta australis]